MADEETTTEPTEAPAAEETPTVAFDPAPAAPKREDLMAASDLHHDNVHYALGAVIPAGAFQTPEGPAQLKLLQKLGVVKYRHEMADAATIAQEYADLHDQIAEYQARIAELEAKQGK
jgi:hypothetical protein